jgi:FSR family fosmidomycin resistance protein-like MFS transporter
MTVKSSPYSAKSELDEAFNTEQVMALAGAHFVHDVFSSFLAPLLPAIIDKLSLSLTLAGSLALFQRLPSAINPFIGLLADRVDLRLFITLAPAVTACAMSLLGIAPSYAILALLLLVAGFSSAAFHVPGPALVARVSGMRVGKGMSFWMTGGELARTVGPLLAVSAVALLTLEGSWPVMLVGIAASVLIFTRIRHIPLQPPKRASNSLPDAWRAMQHVLLPLSGIMLARGFMSGALTTFLPTFISAQGQSLWFGGIALAILEFAGAVGALSAGTLSDRLGRRWVLALAMGTAPFFMLVFLFVSGWMILPLLILMGLSVFSIAPVMMAMVQDHAGDHPATANGLYMGINFVIGALMPLLVGALADRVGLRVAFGSSAVAALIGVPLLYFLPKAEPDQVQVRAK